MVAMYERRGPPDSVNVESWGVDSLGHRYEPGPNQFTAWFYGSSLEAFSWGLRPCEVSTR